MNSPNDNIHTNQASLGRKVHIWVLGCSKSKLHSLSQADCNGKPIDAFAMRLVRRMGAMHSICT